MGRHRIPDPEDSADDESPEEPGHLPHPADGEPARDDGSDEPATPRYDDDADDIDGEPDDGRDLGYPERAYTDQNYPDQDHPEPDDPSDPQTGGAGDGGEWTGSHRAVTTGRRGVSVGVIVALVTVVVVVAAVILWRFFGDALSSRSDASADRCVNGDLAVAVLADPSIAEQVTTLADEYNESASPVGDRCVKVGVKPAGSDQVVNGFAKSWPAELGERPALWIPASGVSAARLEMATDPKTVSDSRSLVTSPVLLAVRPELKTALADQNWASLPQLQANPAGLDGLNLPGWGALRLALPLDGDARFLAAEAVAAASAPPGAPANAGMGAVNILMAGQPKLADGRAATALDALLKAGDPAAAPVHAVAVTEQQLVERGASLPDAKKTLASWLPPGPTAVADYPTVLLAGDWLSEEQVSAASEFARFMRKPEQLGELAKAGFRTEGGSAPQSDVTTQAAVAAPVSVGDDAARATLANALSAPVTNPAVTIMLDQSMPTDEGGQTRLANVVAALNARLRALPPNSSVGLWTFDGTDGRPEVGAGALSDPVDGQPRSAALAAALDQQFSSPGGAVSFTTLRLVYADASANFRPGQKNSVLVITAGPHTDQTLGGAGLQDVIEQSFDPARPVAVNVIDFGDDPDRAAWEAVTKTTGGGYQNLTTSSDATLTAAVNAFIG